VCLFACSRVCAGVCFVFVFVALLCPASLCLCFTSCACALDCVRVPVRASVCVFAVVCV